MAAEPPPRVLSVPEPGLVLLVGVSGSGKSTFAARHFAPTQVVGSDRCRALVSDDENDQSATGDAFDLLHMIVDRRLGRALLTVVDATNVRPHARQRLRRLATEHDVPCVAIVLDVPEALVRRRARIRADRRLDDAVITRQLRDLRRGRGRLDREGFTRHYELRGPFDIIGDVHGCRAELVALLTELGYTPRHDGRGRPVGAHHPERTAVFVGDLVDRGPDSPGVLRLVMGMVADADALCVSGDHDSGLVRALRGRGVRLAHGLRSTLERLDAEPADFRRHVLAFCAGLAHHHVLDGGALVVAHAGLPERYHGRDSGRVRAFALYGQTTGRAGAHGPPVCLPWAEDYRGRALVVHGHVPARRAEWTNNVLCLDTGCVFGGRLTALRYPERELVDVSAQRVWSEPGRPLGEHR